jgi:hypothetical protein
VSIASILGLLMTAALAQQPALTGAPATAQPPLYQGTMIDAKGKNVGRLLEVSRVVREVSGIPVGINAMSSGFQIYPPTDIQVFFQSADCTGTGFLDAANVPVLGFVTTNPPTIPQPSLVYPGKPVAVMTMASIRTLGNPCQTLDTPYTYTFGPMQTVDVATFGLVPPFTSK